jgi:hypothetical protein
MEGAGLQEGGWLWIGASSHWHCKRGRQCARFKFRAAREEEVPPGVLLGLHFAAHSVADTHFTSHMA